MFALGALHDGGHGIEVDCNEARRWFAQAAELGHPMAALMLARYVTRGLGGPRDIEAGRHWFVRAASLGAIEAVEELAALDRVPTSIATEADTAPPLEVAASPETTRAARLAKWDEIFMALPAAQSHGVSDEH